MTPHGKPDWGLQLKSTVYSIDDLSELAVRLGSEVFFDRRGDVYLIENFENGLGKCSTSGRGNDNDVQLSSYTVRSGGYSAKMIGGSTDGWTSQIDIRFPYPVLSKWGFESHFSIPTSFEYIVFYIILFTGSQAIQGIIKFDRANSKLQYSDSSGKFQDIVTDISYFQLYNLFNVIKLVVDFENGKYIRLIANEVEHDLSLHDLDSYPDTSSKKHIKVSIVLKSRNLKNDYSYVDNLIVTQNEPG